MADKYISVSSGAFQEVEATTSSSGAGSAGEMVALDAAGLLNANMMPSGIGPEVVEVTAGEALSQWDLVDIYDNGGTLTARLADAGANNYKALAFCPAAIESAATGNVQTQGYITGSGLTPGARQYLSETPGEYTETPVSGTGKLHQFVGYALSPTVLDFTPTGDTIVLA